MDKDSREITSFLGYLLAFIGWATFGIILFDVWGFAAATITFGLYLIWLSKGSPKPRWDK